MNIFKKFFAKDEQKPSFTSKLKSSFNHTAQKLNNISNIFTQARLDEETLEEFEDLLLSCDFGINVTQQIIEKIKDNKYEKNLDSTEIKLILRDTIEQIIAPCAKDFRPDFGLKPYVIIFVGVNGSGKTTTISKLAAQFRAQQKKIMLVAGDTFRAAANEQLNIWAQRLDVELFSSKTGSDPASIIYNAYNKAKEEAVDLLFIDTAGRLQNKAELMAELSKMIRVMQKIDPEAPHCVLQTLDGNVGQNAINQVEQFREAVNVNGLVMTKLDGTAKGGILAAIAQKFNLPIYFIGTGEKIEDLQPFNARAYANAICDIEE